MRFFGRFLSRVFNMQFTPVKQTLGCRLLLASGEGKPVAKPTPVFLRKSRVGTIEQTICRVEKPFYVAKLAEGFDAKKLVGRTLESG